MEGKRDILSILDLRGDLVAILESAQAMKQRHEAGQGATPLLGKSLAMIFEKASTRTRVSFEVAMTQLGGHALFLSPKDLQLGRGETIADTARVLSRYVDAILYRAYAHANVVELARHATVPVINGLDDVEHPCQIVADLFTVREALGDFEGRKLAYVGDGNNVCHSLLLGCAVVGMDVAVGCPAGYRPKETIVDAARKVAEATGAAVAVGEDPAAAVREADVVYTDVWVSMGQEEERAAREKAFRPYQVNADLLGKAKPGAKVMHCLPAHRGEEITDDVLDGPQSLVLDQAENRLHAQKALLAALLGAA
jgi:ornithine carbamoyltransferase